MAKQRQVNLLGWCLSAMLMLSITVVIGLVVIYMMLAPRLSIRHRMTDLATHYAKLGHQSDLMVFNGSEIYYSIVGRDDSDQEVVLLLKEGSDRPELIDLAELVDYDDLKRQVGREGLLLDQVAFGRYDGQLVWEVRSQLRYYLYDAETGELLKVWG